MFGMSEEDICRAGRKDLVNITDPNQKVLLAKRERTGSVTGVLRFRRSNGTVFPAEIYSAIFTDESGSVRTWLSS